MRKIYIIVLMAFLAAYIPAQELNCKVQVVSSQIQGTEAKRIFGNMEKAIFELMNTRKWTNDNFTINEKIECNIMINVTEKITMEDYKGSILISSSRATFKSSYNSPLFNYEDNNFAFHYVEYQQLNWEPTTFTSNFTSVLAFYAYMMIGYDYDTFSPNGGTEFYQKAQTIVQNAQGANEIGWKAFETNKNRYWLVENTLAPVFVPIRETLYKYHRLGMDIMVERPDEGRAVVLDALQNLLVLHKSRPTSFNMQVFFNAKCDEVVNVFCKGQPDEKTKLIDLLNAIDPARTTKYSKITDCGKN
ncbi:MAG: DUF4835 family protein [Bacteroidia bacterium]|nr:DUF4835 family protein [Bacteroidia bacterium]